MTFWLLVIWIAGSPPNFENSQAFIFRSKPFCERGLAKGIEATKDEEGPTITGRCIRISIGESI